MKDEIYLISDAAKQVQVESHVLRYWEEELKLPIRRNELGHRYYTKEDIEQLKQIKELKEKGLQLKAIKLVISGRDMEILKRDPSYQEEEDLRQMETAAEEKKGMPGENDALREYAGKEQYGERKRFAGQKGLEEQEQVAGQEALEEQEQVAGQEASEEQEQCVNQEEVMEQGTIEETKEDAGQKGSMNQEAVPRQLGKAEKGVRLQLLLHQMISDAVRENNDEMYGSFREILLKELDYQFRMQEEAAQSRDQKRLEEEEEHFRKLDELLGEKRKGKKKKHSWF